MARRRNDPVPVIRVWKCPHCGFAHTAADLRRVDGERLACKQCKQVFNESDAGR